MQFLRNAMCWSMDETTSEFFRKSVARLLNTFCMRQKDNILLHLKVDSILHQSRFLANPLCCRAVMGAARCCFHLLILSSFRGHQSSLDRRQLLILG
mmetsp:Transcript_36370/g.91502  ORF Transcript_36370/g.91502 Transcript_36370/m.91502 type:complete len:97 (+) Transcript_36370:2857-3147(+)